MSRRGSSYRRSSRSVGPLGPAPLLNVVWGGTMTRPSAATSHTVDRMYRYGNNGRRVRNDAILLEAARTFTSRQSETLNTTWAPTNCTVTSNAAVAPDLSLTADVVTTTASGIDTTLAIALVTAPTGNFSMSFWAKSYSSTQECSVHILSGAASTSLNFTPGSEWRRYELVLTGATVAPTITFRTHTYGGTGTAGQTLMVWGIGCNNSTIADSYVTTTTANVIRSADSLTYASGTWPARLATNRFLMKWRPSDDSSRINALLDVLSFGTINNRIAFSAADQFQVVSGGAVLLTTGAITFQDTNLIWLYVNPAAGTFGVRGAATGNADYTIAPWTWPTAVTLRVGGRAGGANELSGWYSNIYSY